MELQPLPDHVGFVSRSAGQTARFGAILGRAARPGDVMLVRGAFGAGKTTLVQGMASGLGASEQATSPSFTLVNEYHAQFPIYHIDLFRLERLDSEMEQAVESCESGHGLTVIEWPDLLPLDLKQGGLTIDMDVLGDEERSIILHTPGTRWSAEELVSMMNQALRTEP